MGFLLLIVLISVSRCQLVDSYSTVNPSISLLSPRPSTSTHGESSPLPQNEHNNMSHQPDSEIISNKQTINTSTTISVPNKTVPINFQMCEEPARNNLLEQQVLALLEDLRELMVTGSDDMPPLDPLHIQHLHIDENIVELPGAYLSVDDLLVKHASTFVVDRLSISLTHIIFQYYSIEFELRIPTLDIEVGHYDLFLSAMDFEVFGRGDGRARAINPKISGRAVFALWTFSLSQTVVEVGLNEFEPQLTGLFHHDGASDFANSFLKNLVPELIQFYEDDISGFLSPLLEDLANQVLGDIFSGFIKATRNSSITN